MACRKGNENQGKRKFYTFASQLNTQFKCNQGCDHGAPVVPCFADSPVSPASPASNHELQTEYLKMARKGGGHSGIIMLLSLSCEGPDWKK